jgi:uncharacterized protein YjeT (DUF2065 family)
MRFQSLLRPWPLVAMWTALCLILMIVGFATLVSQPSGNLNDVVALSDGDVAAVALILWVSGILVLLATLAIRRIARKLRRAAAR